MNVYWTESALVAPASIEEYIARHSAQYARALVARIFARSDQLASRPLLGPIVHEYEDESIREVFENPYRIIYRVDADRVDIVAVVHAARMPPRGFE